MLLNGLWLKFTNMSIQMIEFAKNSGETMYYMTTKDAPSEE